MLSSLPVILLLRPIGHWSVIGAELRHVSSLGRYMEVRSALRPQWMADDAGDDLRQTAQLCEELLPESLYTRYANKKLFRHLEDFWATDDATLQQHIKRMSDQRLMKVVRLAAVQDIPILFSESEGTALHVEDRLLLTDAPATPIMCFSRHEQGISYRLRLRVAADGAAQAEVMDDLATHRITVLCHEPGLFIMDHRLLFLGEGFSGKLLLPFSKKSVLEIPRHIENDYFRRFILRNVSRAEIVADGFDILDTGEQPVPQLLTDKSVDGLPMLSLRFRYGDSDYLPESKVNGRVRLAPTDDGGFRFTRQMRDRQREQHFCDLLASLGGGLAEWVGGQCRFPSTQAMVDWLRSHGPQLRQWGFDVVQPSESVYYIGPLEVEQSDTWSGDWLQTDVTIVLDDGRLRIPFLDLRDTILRGEQVFMLPTGELLLIPAEWLKRYGDMLLIGAPHGKGFRRHRCQMREEPGAAGTIETIGTTGAAGYVLPPRALRATLRPYQQVGFQWLWRNYESQTGCCLSDEMGLGKTLQAIALLLKAKEEHGAVGGPAAATGRDSEADQGRVPLPGLLFTEEEMRGEGPSLTTQASSPRGPLTFLVIAPASVVHNWRNELSRFAPSLIVCSYTGHIATRRDKRPALMRFDVVLTTYRTLVNDIDFLSEQQFDMVVFDESQTFKTATSQVHRAVSRLQARHRLALSGTPVENSLMELWSLMNVLNAPLLGSRRAFHDTFVSAITRQLEDERATLLRRLIAPYFLKRTKEEVLTDLPQRQDEVVVCPMTEAQATQYAEELSRARNELLAVAPGGKATGGELTADVRLHVLAAIQRLRHIANGEGKMAAIFDHLEPLRGTSHKVLLFSEYVSMLERVASEMHRRGWGCAMLTGRTKDREQVITHFQQTASCQFFLISLKAGGVGLNLTAADYVMLMDPWWNEAAEEQAIARSHRIGQHQPVFVYRFVSENTLEQQILTLQERKQTLIDNVMPFIASPMA